MYYRTNIIKMDKIELKKVSIKAVRIIISMT